MVRWASDLWELYVIEIRLIIWTFAGSKTLQYIVFSFLKKIFLLPLLHVIYLSVLALMSSSTNKHFP